MTRTITDLAAGSGLIFDDLGEHALTAIDGRQQLLGLQQDGIR